MSRERAQEIPNTSITAKAEDFIQDGNFNWSKWGSLNASERERAADLTFAGFSPSYAQTEQRFRSSQPSRLSRKLTVGSAAAGIVAAFGFMGAVDSQDAYATETHITPVVSSLSGVTDAQAQVALNELVEKQATVVISKQIENESENPIQIQADIQNAAEIIKTSSQLTTDQLAGELEKQDGVEDGKLTIEVKSGDTADWLVGGAVDRINAGDSLYNEQDPNQNGDKRWGLTVASGLAGESLITPGQTLEIAGEDLRSLAGAIQALDISLKSTNNAQTSTVVPDINYIADAITNSGGSLQAGEKPVSATENLTNIDTSNVVNSDAVAERTQALQENEYRLLNIYLETQRPLVTVSHEPTSQKILFVGDVGKLKILQGLKDSGEPIVFTESVDEKGRYNYHFQNKQGVSVTLISIFEPQIQQIEVQQPVAESEQRRESVSSMVEDRNTHSNPDTLAAEATTHATVQEITINDAHESKPKDYPIVRFWKTLTSERNFFGAKNIPALYLSTSLMALGSGFYVASAAYEYLKSKKDEEDKKHTRRATFQTA